MAAKEQKRKLELHTLEMKYYVIKALEDGKTRAEVCRQFNLKHNTLCGWIANAAKIKDLFDYGVINSKAKKMKLAKNPDLEEALYRWYCDSIKEDPSMVIGREMFTEKAMQLAKHLGIENFAGSNGWFMRFKQRYNLIRKRHSKEAKDSNMLSIEDWKETVEKILGDYESKDVYSAVESPLYYNYTPCKTSVKATAAQKRFLKERFTLLVVVNMEGSDRSGLLVIGKRQKPKCFDNTQHLPLSYESTAKALMTSEVFMTWLQKFDRCMVSEGRKVALLLEDCPVHSPVQGLKAVQVYFLPPNSAPITHPMNQGIVRKLKFHYRKLLTRRRLSLLESGDGVNFRISLLSAMHLVKQAWDLVTESTVQECFRKVFFLDGSNVATTSSYPDIDPDFYSALGMQYKEFEEKSSTAETGVACYAIDEEVLTTLKSDDMSSEEESVEDSAAAAVPTATEALGALDVLRRYGIAAIRDKAVLAHIDAVSDAIEKDLLKTIKPEKANTTSTG